MARFFRVTSENMATFSDAEIQGYQPFSGALYTSGWVYDDESLYFVTTGDRLIESLSLNYIDDYGIMKTVNAVVSNGGTRADFDNLADPDKSDSSPVTFNVVMSSAEVEFFYFTETVISAATAANLVLYINDVEVEASDIVVDGDVVSVKANEGFIILSASLSYIDDYAEQKYIPLEVDESGEIASAIINDSNFYDITNLPIAIGASFNSEPIGLDVLANNKVYIVDDEKMRELSTRRFVTDSIGAVYDYGEFILGLVELPFSIDDEYLGGSGEIELGPRNSEVLAEQVLYDNLSLDLGTISVPNVHNNLLDFSGVICILHLPSASPINLDPRYVIGETISIEYLVSLYDGVATINIASSKVDGDVFVSNSTQIGSNVPYSIVRDGVSVSNNNIDISGTNNILTPFIEVISNDALLKDAFFSADILDESVLSDVDGYIEVENIDLKGDFFLSERDLIRSYLTSGVIIND